MAQAGRGRRYYFDHNAGAAVDPRVLQRFVEVEHAHGANPASLHAAGREARAVLEASRAAAAAALEVAADDLFFVSGGTEANNLVVAGAGDPALPVLLAPLEHPSVLAAAERRGARWWGVDAEGRAVVADVGGPIGLVCLAHGQNEVGTLQPVGAAAALAHRLGVPLHVDASQSMGRVPLREAVAAADTLAVAAHKAGGLKGCTVLVVRGGAGKLRPLLHGGGQERGLRPGTTSVALAAAAALAVELAVREQGVRAAAMAAARAAFLDGLAGLGGVRVLTPLGCSLPNTLMLQIEDVDGRALLPALDLAGVEASQGSACASGSPVPPRVLREMELDDEAAQRCVRFSFSHATVSDEARAGGGVVAEVVNRMRARRNARS